MDVPGPEEVTQALSTLDVRAQKIVAGMLGVMMKNPSQVRDREWISERLAEMTVMAGEFEADSPEAGVAAVHAYLEQNSRELLGASYLLFQRVGLDLQPRAAEGFTFDEALRCGLAYLPSLSGTGASKPEVDRSEEFGRELGEQPLAGLMAERDLKPKDLVTASSEQLTHKMVTRAIKGRRLTANTMGKVIRAWNQATGHQHGPSDLFNYEP